MGEGKNKKCFQDLSECQLFLEFPFNIFFSTLLLQSSTPSLNFTSQNLMRTLFIFFFLTLFSFFWIFFFWIFFLLWILTQTTTLKQIDQIQSWNTMDKGFKKERLIKRLNGVTSDNVSKKRKIHIWLKVDKNGQISSLKDKYSSFNINDFKRFKCGIYIYIYIFYWPKERTMRLQQGKYVTYFQMNFKIRNNK